MIFPSVEYLTSIFTQLFEHKVCVQLYTSLLYIVLNTKCVCTKSSLYIALICMVTECMCNKPVCCTQLYSELDSVHSLVWFEGPVCVHPPLYSLLTCMVCSTSVCTTSPLYSLSAVSCAVSSWYTTSSRLYNYKQSRDIGCKG